MPEAINLKCPECNAALDAEAGASTVTCEYCGTRAHIQHRTRFLQRPVPMRHVPEGERVALEQRSVGRLLAMFLGVMLLVGVAPVAVCGLVCGGSIELLDRLKSSDWDGAGAVLRDINGDGTVDIIGRTRRLKPEDVILLAAFDGKTGDRLWESEVLGPQSDLVGSPMGVAGGVAVLGSGGPGLVAVSLTDGSIRWRARLSEKVERICAGDAKAVRVRTADKKNHAVALADGKAAPAAATDDACGPLPGDDPRADQPHRLVRSTHDKIGDVKIEGMSVDSVLIHPGSGASVALGYRYPGTDVPTVARYRWPAATAETPAAPDSDPVPAGLQGKLAGAMGADKARAALDALKHMRLSQRSGSDDAAPQLLWKADVPGVDPFSVETGGVDPTEADLNDEVLVVAYETKKTYVYRLTAFELNDGKRRWDVELPGNLGLDAVLVTSRLALVSRTRAVHAFDLKTGEPVFVAD